MSDSLRLILLLGMVGSAITLVASLVSWWGDGSRNLRRLVRKVLGGPPDAEVICAGRNAAIGLRLEADKAVVMWDGGAKALLYPLGALEGAELIVGHAVVARVWRGEPRKALDAVDQTARQVTLRLVFDNPRDPEFVLDLWLPEDERRRNDPGPTAAIHEARTWLARAEAILRRPRSAPTIATAPVVEERRLEPRPEPEPARKREPREFDGDAADDPELPF